MIVVFIYLWLSQVCLHPAGDTYEAVDMDYWGRAGLLNFLMWFDLIFIDDKPPGLFPIHNPVQVLLGKHWAINLISDCRIILKYEWTS